MHMSLDSLLERLYRTLQGCSDSVRFGYGSVVEQFERFRFSVPAVPLPKRVSCISVQFNRKGRFRFRFLENGSGGSGSAFRFGKKKNGSDGSGFRFRFGSWATLKLSGLPFCRAFVVTSFRAESEDLVMDLCVNFLSGFLGALHPFKRRTEWHQKNSQHNPPQNPCKIHARSG